MNVRVRAVVVTSVRPSSVKNAIRDDEHVGGRDVTAIEMAHAYGVPLRSGSTSCIHSVFSSGFVESLWN